MKLSTRARYALRAMMYISRETGEGVPINLAEVARHTGVSIRYLEQIAIPLKNAKLLKAVPGKKGGHFLARPADRIKLGEIVEAAIGEINVVECVLEPDTCIRVNGCECRELYCILNQRILDTLNQFTLADLEEGRVGLPTKK
jgi:Rrf2 family protein